MAQSITVSPDGSKVFVTGSSEGITSGLDYATVAYDASTGRQLWVQRYSSTGTWNDGASSVSVSPGGSIVFVTGGVALPDGTGEFGIIAYRASTGRALWTSFYNGPADGSEGGRSVSVSPDGDRLFVTGISPGISSGFDFATVAYEASTGRQEWVARYNGPGNGDDTTYGGVVVSPGGGKVFVAGPSVGETTDYDYATVAYSSSSGAQLWVARYNGPQNSFDIAYSLAVSPGGGKVFVTGSSPCCGDGDYATVAYSASTGRQLWASRYTCCGYGLSIAYSIAVSPGGSTVFVTGSSPGEDGDGDYATVAYAA